MWIGRTSRRWNRTVTRDANGVLANAAPYTLEGERPREPRTAILFIHGFDDTPEVWQLLAPRVHELTGVTCRAMRLPYISAPLRLQHRARLEHWLDAIRDEVARLRTCHKKVFLCGHSLGGGLAFLNSHVADGVIVFAPLVHARRKHVWLFGLADVLLPFTRACRTPFPDPITTRDGRVYAYTRDRYIAFAIYRAMFGMTKRLQKVGRGVPSAPRGVPIPGDAGTDGGGQGTARPTLAFISLRDRLIDIPATLRFLDGAKIITTSDAGHVLPLDVGWEKRAEDVAAFVAGRDGE